MSQTFPILDRVKYGCQSDAIETRRGQVVQERAASRPHPTLKRRFKGRRHKPYERWFEVVMRAGDVAACHVYVSCTCGQRFVVQQSGELSDDEFGWDASDDLDDARSHFGPIRPARIRWNKKLDRLLRVT